MIINIIYLIDIIQLGKVKHQIDLSLNPCLCGQDIVYSGHSFFLIDIPKNNLARAEKKSVY